MSSRQLYGSRLATHSADGLVIKAFSVPPAMAARGVTGEALAAETVDRLNGISDAAVSAETQRTVSGDWGHDISIQIPETGVSLSQVDEWLRGRLGHQRRVTAELMQGDDGRLTLVAAPTPNQGAYRRWPSLPDKIRRPQGALCPRAELRTASAAI